MKTSTAVSTTIGSRQRPKLSQDVHKVFLSVKLNFHELQFFTLALPEDIGLRLVNYSNYFMEVSLENNYT